MGKRKDLEYLYKLTIYPKKDGGFSIEVYEDPLYGKIYKVKNAEELLEFLKDIYGKEKVS